MSTTPFLNQGVPVNLTFGSAGTQTLVANTTVLSIWVKGWLFTRNETANAVNLTFKDSTPATLYGPFAADNVFGNGYGMGACAPGEGWFCTAPGKDLDLAADAACTITGGLTYFLR